MTLEQLRVAFATIVAGAAIAGSACARERVRHPDTPVLARHLGESTASPGRDPDRPVVRSLDTQEVSATISRPLAGPPPAPAGPPGPQAQPTSPAPPAPVQPAPTTTTPVTTTPVTTTPVTTTPITTSPITSSPSPTPPPSPPPPPSEPQRPGVFSPPPPPPTP
jgi:hypothetical protein